MEGRQGGPNLFPDNPISGTSSPMRGVEGPLDVSGGGGFYDMSDYGDGVTKGVKALGRYFQYFFFVNIHIYTHRM